MSKSQKFLQPLCFGFVFLCCGMNFSLAEDCSYDPGINCDATLATKDSDERSIVFIKDHEVATCRCEEDNDGYKWLKGAYLWLCNAGAQGSGIADSFDIELGKARSSERYVFSIGGRATKIAGITPDAYWGKDLCDYCKRGSYYDADAKECKESEYPLPCDSNQNVGDTCIFNDGAKHAECQDIGMKSNGYNVLTCNANECKDDYLLQLKPDGNPSGFCIKKSDAQKSCAEKCELKLHKNPNNNAKDAAYIPGDCECKQEGGCELKLKDGTILKNVDWLYLWADDGYLVYKKYGSESENELYEKSLTDLVEINGTSVNMEALNSETTEYAGFKCSKWGENGYFAFACTKGYDGGKKIGEDGSDTMYDKCIKKTASPQPAQPTVVDDTKKEIENAQKVLDDFYAWAKNDEHRSVWKDSEGKFNTTRLASDLTAGVVLGTVGGVVSGVVIKKKQVEKGFDALHCIIGGQPVADWGDEFRVGFYQR